MVLTIVQWFCSFSYGFILPLDIVLSKTVALSGNQIFSVEQDVIFNEAGEDFIVRETWLIEGYKNLKLTAVGQGSLKDLLKLTFVYNSKHKTSLIGKTKTSETVSSDFFERYLSVRSADSFKKHLNDLSISPLVRLSRVAGAVAFAIGEPSSATQLKPQLWIDQETFQIRKMRLPSTAEVSLDDYQIFKQTNYPMSKKINWSGHSILIKVRQVSTKTGASLASFYPQNLDQPSEINLSTKGDIGLFIQEFYKRFR